MARGFDPSGFQYNCLVLLLRAAKEPMKLVTWPLLSARYLCEVLVCRVECPNLGFRKIVKSDY